MSVERRINERMCRLAEALRPARHDDNRLTGEFDVRINPELGIADVMLKPTGEAGPWVQTTVAAPGRKDDPDYDPDEDDNVRIVVWVQTATVDAQVHVKVDPETGGIYVGDIV